MANFTGSWVRGLLVAEDSFSFDRLVAKDDPTMPSTYTQAGSRVGIPSPDQESLLLVSATGGQAEDAHHEVVTLTAGVPGMDDARFGWRDLTALDKTNEIRGRDPATVIHDFHVPHWTTDNTHVRSRHHLLTLHSGRVLVLGDQRNAGLDYQHLIYRYDPVDSTLTSCPLDPEDAADDLGPTAFQLPPTAEVPLGRVVLITRAQTRTGSREQVDVYESDDEGDTWATRARTALDIGVPETIGAGAVSVQDLRVAYSPESGTALLLWAYTYIDGANTRLSLAQYASSDGGCSFQQITENFYATHYVGAADFQQVRVPDILAIPGGGYLVGAWVLDPAGVSTTNYMSQRMGSAFAPIPRFTEVITGYGPTAVTRADLALWREPSGQIGAMIRRIEVEGTGAGGGHLSYYVSMDYGVTWSTRAGIATLASRAVFSADDNYTVAPVADFRLFGAAETCGRVLLGCRWNSTEAHAQYSTGLLTLGGFRSVTVPMSDALAAASSDLDVISWARQSGAGKRGHCYLPIDTPNALGWTAGAGAAGDASFVNASDRTVLSINTTGTGSGTGNARWYERTWADATVSRAFAEFIVDEVSGGATTTDQVAAKLRISDGVTSYAVEVRFSGTQLQLYDTDAAANLGSAGTASGMVRVQVAIDATGYAQAWYSSDTGVAPRVYRMTGGALAGAAVATNRIAFGQFVAAAAESSWSMVGSCHWASSFRRNAGTVNIGVSGNWVNPTDLNGIPLPVVPRLIVPRAAASGEGLRIGASSGPSSVGETWQIRAAYGYPLEAAFTGRFPSPSQRWRTTSDGVAFTLIWDPLSGTTARKLLSGTMIGLYAGETNIRRLILAGYSGGAWTDLITTNSSTGLSALGFARYADCLVPNTGTAASRSFIDGEFAGAWVELDDGAGNVRKRKIRTNTGGVWNKAVTGLRPRIYIDGLTGAEPVSGAMIITPRHSLAVIQEMNTDYEYFRLTIADSANADGYFELGTLLIGRIKVLSPEWSDGYARTLTPRVEGGDLPSGGRLVRRRGPVQRGVEVGWTTPVISTAIQGTPSAPNYVTGSVGGFPVAHTGAVPMDVWGLVETLQGEETPVVICQALPVPNPAALVQIHHPPGWTYLYGRIASASVRIENVAGNEWESEVSRVSTLTIREEV